MFQAESYVGHKLCRPGDLAVNTMWAWMAALGVAGQPGIVSPAYAVYRLRECDAFVPEYLDHLLRIKPYVSEYYSRSTGIRTSRLRLYPENFLDIPIIRAPLEEQVTMVAYLQAKDHQIADFIRAKQRLIELLNEQKQAIIHRAVTRGLDPDATMKPTGLDWLPEVPAHWPVAALRMRYSVELGKMLDAKRITGQHSVAYLRNVDVQWDQVNTRDLPAMDIEPCEYERYTLRTGDMLVCEGGEVGRSAFWNGELPLCGFQKALHRVRVLNREQDCPRFLYYLMYTAAKRGIFHAGGSESTIAHLTGEKLRAHRFPFPPKVEQDAIVRHLDDATVYAEKVMQRARREIDLIREYRTRLISDVVTGKLDVRGVELPESDVGQVAVEVNPDGLESVVAEGSPDPEEARDAALRHQ